MINRYRFTLLMCLSLSTPLFANPLKPYTQLDTFLLSEPTSLDAANKQWHGSYQPNGEKQMASLWFETGLKKGNWSLGLLYREELQLNFKPDSADLYYAVENSVDLTTGRNYQIDLNAYRFRGLGARINKHFTVNNTLNLSAGASLFAAGQLLDGRLTGSARANADDEYEYFISGDYRYSEDVLFERKNIEKPTGVGVALDLSLNWQPNPQWHLRGKVRDLAGAIFWKDVPYTEATANSDTTRVGEDGFAQVDPILSGFEGYQPSHTQRLRPAADFEIGYRFKNTAYSASLKSKHNKALNLFAIGGERKVGNKQLALHYWPQVNTLEAAYTGKTFGFRLGLDDIDFSDSRTLWLSLIKK